MKLENSNSGVRDGGLSLAVVACAVLEDEVNLIARKYNHIKRIEILEMGLHDHPTLLHSKLQQIIDTIETDRTITHIALVFGLCSRSTENITTKRCVMVIPRAHDCITLLLGRRERYDAYIKEHPGTYWYSHGWVRQRKDCLEENKYDEYVEKYGADNAAYLMQVEQGWIQQYNRAVYVDMDFFEPQEDLRHVSQLAADRKWQFDHLEGSGELLEELLAGRWDEQRFLVLNPGESVKMTGKENVMDKTS